MKSSVLSQITAGHHRKTAIYKTYWLTKFKPFHTLPMTNHYVKSESTTWHKDTQTHTQSTAGEDSSQHRFSKAKQTGFSRGRLKDHHAAQRLELHYRTHVRAALWNRKRTAVTQQESEVSGSHETCQRVTGYFKRAFGWCRLFKTTEGWRWQLKKKWLNIGRVS